MTSAAPKNPPPRPRAAKLSIAEYEKLTARQRAYVDNLMEQDELARKAWEAVQPKKDAL